MKFIEFRIFVFIILITASMAAQNKTFTVTPINDIIPCYEAKINGVKFSIGIDDYRESLFITTNDANFEIDDKPIIGRQLSSFQNKSNFKLARGWGYYLKINEDWYVAFKYDDDKDKSDNELENKLDEDSKVMFAFQYNFRH